MAEKLTQGYIQVYTGNGKGKSTAAFGLALRAVGSGMRVVLIQFMKVKGCYAEEEGFKMLGDNLQHFAYGGKNFVKKGQGSEEDYALAKAGLAKALEAITDPQNDLVILDEINNALYFELLTTAEVLEVLGKKLPQVEVVLTGRNAPPEIIDAADLVTEMKEIKHYYTKGVNSRKGIEF